ncbi:MAG: putative DNA binding domain-containing protein [Candidatus Accumulibacter sp.]|jgi:predicted HTH transcriptional regulator|nr:putative DNA binding domain-containing protein [Accumulibacter sp.]
MRLTHAELLKKIRLGEDSYLELKEVRFAGDKLRGPSQDDLADELAAFANSAGGVLVLGVEDKSRAVVGIKLDKLDAVEALVRQACEDAIKQPLAPLIERLTLPDAQGVEQPVIRVDVPRSLFVHQSPGGYLHRVGSSKRPIAPDQLARLFQQRSQSRLIRFDETPVPTATFADLDEVLWRRFTGDLEGESAETVLSKLAMGGVDEEGVWRPSVAGVLMAAPDPRVFFSTAYIQAVAYAGMEIAPSQHDPYQIDAADIFGPLDRQIADACHFVRRNMRTWAHKGPAGGRTDTPQYDLVAVFEAITNAVAHRDYSLGGSKVRLRMFENRLEIYTPGMLVNTMTPETLRYRQAARNEVIASLLARCPVPPGLEAGRRSRIMDKRGEGVPIILRGSLLLSGISPVFRLIGDSELLLTIYAANGESKS